MRQIIFILLWLGCSSLGQAQQHYIDSLQNLLRHNSDKEKTIIIQQQVAEWYRANEQETEAIQMAEQSLKTSLELPENRLGVTKAYSILSNIYTNTEDFDRAKEYIDKAYKSAERQKNTLALAYAQYASAVLYAAFFDSENTLRMLQQSLANIPDPEQEAQLACKIYYQLYGIYTEWNDAEKSLKYIQTALSYARKSGNRNLEANVYSALSVVYSFKYETTQQEKYLDSIMQPLDNAILLYQQYPGQVMNTTYAHCLNNKASYYLKYYELKNTLIRQEIREEIQEALAVVPASNEVLMASAYGILSELSMTENDLQKAEHYLDKAYELLAQKKKPYYHTLINVLNSLVNLNMKKGDYKQALGYQRKAAEYSNLLFNEQSAAVTKRLEAQFEFSKKEEKILALQEKADSQKKQKYLLIALIGLGVMGAFFMFRSYHLNLKFSLAREKQLSAEKNEAALQVKYEQEEQARLKAEQDLLTMQQQKLNDEVMANQLQLQHKNNVLLQLQEKLSKQETVNMQQILRDEARMDGEFERSKYQIQEMHPDFFRNLNKHAVQKLTSLDQKYCAYLYLGMDTKQIAAILNVEAKSVRMTKYRLKQKFGLDAETDLLNYLKQIG